MRRLAVLGAALAPWLSSRACAADAPQVQAYPTDPKGLVRNGSRLNPVILARVGNDGLSDDACARSADGVVAYSDVGAHQGCPVTAC